MFNSSRDRKEDRVRSINVKAILRPVFAGLTLLAIGTICAAQTFSSSPLPTSFYPAAAVGGDGNVWFTEIDPMLGALTSLASISPTGTVKNYPLPSGITPFGYASMAKGSDGNIRFTGSVNGSASGYVARVTPSGSVTAFTGGIPANGRPNGLVAASGGLVQRR